MKKILLLLILNSTFLIVNCYSQQYGWVDISNNLPSSNGTASLSDMHWLNENEGWICSSALGEIYHTTDGGQSFTTQTTQYSTYSIYMLSSTEGYAGGLNGRVYRTTNGGTNWNVLGSIGGTLLSISFPPSSTTGYCSGYSGRIYRITSTGVSSMTSGVAANLASISFPGSQGWVCGEDVIEHFDGTNWVLDQSAPDATYNAICMINNTTGWAVGDNGVIIKTTDGVSWSNQSNPDTSKRTLLDVFFLNASEGWAVGNGGVILHTTNGGTLWTIEGAGITTNMLRAVQFTSSTNGYVLGNNKTLFKYTLLTDLDEQSGQPKDFKLEQNYPNPFNPSTNIQYAIPQDARGETQEVSLKVFDVLGNEIVTLVNEEKLAGNYEVEFDPSTINHHTSSGVYYYQLTSGDFVQTKKMILLK
jgi:photosystem II stability/assembly factor-like uncharacterized protein